MSVRIYPCDPRNPWFDLPGSDHGFHRFHGCHCGHSQVPDKNSNKSVEATAHPARVLSSWVGARTLYIEAPVTLVCASPPRYARV